MGIDFIGTRKRLSAKLVFSMLNQLALPSLLVFWGIWQIRRMSIPVLDLDGQSVRHMMKERSCAFTVDLDENFDNELLLCQTGWHFMLDKYVSVIREISDVEQLTEWLTSQMISLNFIEEILFCDKFIAAVIILAVINAVVYSFTCEPLVSALPKEPSAKKTKLQLLPEQFIILTSVIIRTPDSILHEKRFALAQHNLQLKFILTDVTVFALWFAYLTSISMTVKRLTDRLEEVILPGKYSFSQWDSGPFLKLAFLLFSAFCTSVSTVSFTVTSYRLVHPLYAFIFIIESVDLLLKCCYAVVLFLHSILHKNAKNTEGQRFLRFISAIMEHLLAIGRYSLYIYIGGFVNNKILPLFLITPAIHHFNGLLQLLTSSSQIFAREM